MKTPEQNADKTFTEEQNLNDVTAEHAQTPEHHEAQEENARTPEHHDDSEEHDLNADFAENDYNDDSEDEARTLENLDIVVSSLAAYQTPEKTQSPQQHHEVGQSSLQQTQISENLEIVVSSLAEYQTPEEGQTPQHQELQTQIVQTQTALTKKDEEMTLLKNTVEELKTELVKAKEWGEMQEAKRIEAESRMVEAQNRMVETAEEISLIKNTVNDLKAELVKTQEWGRMQEAQKIQAENREVKLEGLVQDMKADILNLKKVVIEISNENQNSRVKRIKAKERVPAKQDPAFQYGYGKSKRPASSKMQGKKDEDDFEKLPAKKTNAANQKKPAPERKNPNKRQKLNEPEPPATQKMMKEYVPKDLQAKLQQIIDAEPEGQIYGIEDNWNYTAYFSDIKIILADDRVENTMINAYAHWLNNKFGEATPESDNAFVIIESGCWTYIAEQNTEHNRNMAKREVEDKIFSPIKTHKFLFPVHSNGNIPGGNKDHWTLLVYDVDTGIWTHYNSMRNRKDDYLIDAEQIKNYVENLKQERAKKSDEPSFLLLSQNSDESGKKSDAPSFTLLSQSSDEAGKKSDAPSSTGKVVYYQDCPQQDPNSVDCGYLVCYMMNRICAKKEIEKNMEGEELKKFKAHLISIFIRDYQFQH